MILDARPGEGAAGRTRAWGRGLASAAAGLAVSAAALGVETGWLAGTHFYSTAEPPREYRGPRPTLQLALGEATTAPPPTGGPWVRGVLPARGPEAEPASVADPPPDPAPARRSAPEVPRVASS